MNSNTVATHKWTQISFLKLVTGQVIRKKSITLSIIDHYAPQKMRSSEKNRKVDVDLENISARFN